jgi:hypothetical protein
MGDDMSFGKRGKGEGHPARDLLPPMEEAAPTTVRTAVTNPGGIDKGFIALAIGVVLVSGGGALAAPSVLGMFGGQVRPIEEVVAGLDRAQAKAVLAHEAFPDAEGRTFMTALQKHFPTQHDKLTTVLADEALSGGNRDALLMEFSKWSIEFATPNLTAISRTGAEGFDEFLTIADGAFDLVEKTAGCTPQKLEAFISNPDNMQKQWAYGSEGYKFSMKSSAKLINLAAKGRNAPPAPTDMRDEDNQAFMTFFVGMMSDPQVKELMQASMRSRGKAAPNSLADMPDINVCKLGQSISDKLRRLPHGTKERIFGMAAQGFGQMQGRMMNDIMSGKGASMNGLPLMLPKGSGSALGQMEYMAQQ